MQSSKPLTAFALILMLGFGVPLPCSGSLAGNIISTQTTMPENCHGHRHLPSPPHRCCHTGDHIPAATPVASTPVDVMACTEYASAFVAIQPVHATSSGSGENDSPPSRPLVLRIWSSILVIVARAARTCRLECHGSL